MAGTGKDLSDALLNYVSINREERNLCAILYSILLHEENLALFLDFIKGRCGVPSSFPDNDVDIFYEFAFLRDYWFSLGKSSISSNLNKYNFIRKELGFLNQFPDIDLNNVSEIEKFNKSFGGRSKDKIDSPSNWIVAKMCESEYLKDKNNFVHACKFKWSFNAKPDIVLVGGGKNVICIEAKLESSESSYPTSGKEKELFDAVAGIESRVGQVELQKYMFDILNVESDFIFLEKKNSKDTSLSWCELFALDFQVVPPFAKKWINENKIYKV